MDNGRQKPMSFLFQSWSINYEVQVQVQVHTYVTLRWSSFHLAAR